MENEQKTINLNFQIPSEKETDELINVLRPSVSNEQSIKIMNEILDVYQKNELGPWSTAIHCRMISNIMLNGLIENRVSIE